MPDELSIDPADSGTIEAMAEAPARAAFEVWYASMAAVNVADVSPDAWKGLGEHKRVWLAVADAAINRHIEQCEEGPRVDPPE
jgi:hypothetical protein